MNFRFAERLFIVLITLGMAASCSKGLEKEIVSSWPDGSAQKVFYYKTAGGVREKVAEDRFYENGQQEMHGEYKNGVQHGHWTYWFENGKIWSEGFFENGMRAGKSVVWRENGFKNYEGNYAQGKPHGTWTFYDIDGTRNKDVMIEHGQPVDEKIYKEGPVSPAEVPDSVSFIVR